MVLEDPGLSCLSCPLCTSRWPRELVTLQQPTYRLKISSSSSPYPRQSLVCHVHTRAGTAGHVWERGVQIQTPGLTLSTWFTISFMRFCTVRKSLCFLNYGKDTERFPGWRLLPP